MENRILTVYYTYQSGKGRPLIRLQGKWLQDLGFKTGSKIEVKEENGVLSIRAVPSDNTAKQSSTTPAQRKSLSLVSYRGRKHRTGKN